MFSVLAISPGYFFEISTPDTEHEAENGAYALRPLGVQSFIVYVAG